MNRRSCKFGWLFLHDRFSSRTSQGSGEIYRLGSEQAEKLQQLRAVSFHYKHAPQGPLQYGLIAEEVAKVYPELVTRNAKGEVEGVRYDELAPLLLNEVQHQQQALSTQQQEITTQKARSARQEQKIEALEAENKNLR